MGSSACGAADSAIAPARAAVVKSAEKDLYRMPFLRHIRNQRVDRHLAQQISCNFSPVSFEPFPPEIFAFQRGGEYEILSCFDYILRNRPMGVRPISGFYAANTADRGGYAQRHRGGAAAPEGRRQSERGPLRRRRDADLLCPDAS